MAFTDKGGASGSTRVLGSNSAKKESETATTYKEILKTNVLSASSGSRKPKKNLPAVPSEKTTRKGGKSNDALSEKQAEDTTANKYVTDRGSENKETSTNSVLPPEIILDILSRLPVEFLGRLMLVCKHWYAMIQDRYLIEKHMSRELKYTNDKPLVQNGMRSNTYTHVYSCDGLNLWKNTSTQKYHISNLATNQCLELPDPHKGSHKIFFSYVPSTSIYKFVSIYDDENSIECCEVLSEGNDWFSWRFLKLPTRELLNRNRTKLSVVSTGDAVHCVRVIASGADMVEEVVSLDLGSEQFTVTNLPRGQYKSWDKVWPLNFNGKLALVDKIGADLCVLVLEDYKKQKWGKRKTLIPFTSLKKIEDIYGTVSPINLNLEYKSEKLFFRVKDGKFVSYDMKSAGDRKILEVTNYVQYSLVHLKGMRPGETKAATQQS